jgi:hypothetical protein
MVALGKPAGGCMIQSSCSKCFRSGFGRGDTHTCGRKGQLCICFLKIRPTNGCVMKRGGRLSQVVASNYM